MTPVKPSKYEFDPQSLVDIRTKLGIKQSKMADLLGVPTNTLSRWETGATTPDAASLAAIYSIAVEEGVTPVFFRVRRKKVKQKPKGPSRLLVMWDLQNVAVSDWNVAEVDDYIKKELGKRFPSTTYRRFKAFASTSQSAATEILENLGWRVWEDHYDMDEDIIEHCRADCGQEPKETVLVLITKDGDFTELIGDLRNNGVKVYLLAPDHPSNALLKAVGETCWIRWSHHIIPYGGFVMMKRR